VTGLAIDLFSEMVLVAVAESKIVPAAIIYFAFLISRFSSSSLHFLLAGLSEGFVRIRAYYKNMT
jgi:hypothetical protein